MTQAAVRWDRPFSVLDRLRPDYPVYFFSPRVLQNTARSFQAEFPGQVSYAVKANDRIEVLANLAAAGVAAFDVASPHEIDLVRRVVPGAALHYNNPIRSRAEIAHAMRAGVSSYALDAATELRKLVDGGVPEGCEISVRFKLPVKGAAYDFGEKFGTDPDRAVELLRAVAAAGYRPSITFHPGTQCPDGAAWIAYIRMAARIAARAGVTPERLNVGGGFAAHRTGDAPNRPAIIASIAQGVAESFETPPALVCEPGRAMVADAFALAVRIKALPEDGAVFLNDGIYGQLAEMPVLGMTDRFAVLGPDGPRRGRLRPCRCFGPTCDSLDTLPGKLMLPEDIAEGDWLLFQGMGAYGHVTATGFNGYGQADVVTVDQVDS
ncbi:MAG: type III PLP-dependent enzyme [Pseudomonadota bacterium]